MFLVWYMLFLEGDIPFLFIEIWEESIGLLRGVVYFCQAEAVCQGQSLGIDACTANDIDILFP